MAAAELDHVIVAVRDLDAAVGQYEAILGLPAAVRSEHPRGTRNALFLFERGPYLELLAPYDAADQGSSARALRQFLDSHGEGLFGLALAPRSLDAAVMRLRDLGLDIMEPAANSGTDREGRRREWRAAALPETAADHSYLVEHTNAAWKQELRPGPLPGRADSAALDIHHAAFDVADASTASRDWEERYGLPQTDAVVSERLGARVNIHAAGSATVEFVGAMRAGPVADRIARRGHGLSSLAFEVRDLDAAVRAVRDAGIIIAGPEPGGLPASRVARIDSASACGVAAELIQFD